MSNRNKQLSQRWFEEVWNKQNRTAIDELLDPKVIAHGLSGTDAPVVGPEGFKAFHDSFLQAFPDIHTTVTHCFAEDDHTTIQFTFTAAHTGPGFGPPTGRRVKVSGICIVRWRDGKIVEGWNEFDRHGLMQQIAGQPG